MMLLSSKYFLSSILLGMTTMIPSILADETPMIVGGNDADPDEYPYYVKLPGCGGTLIAPDMVLTAAHCRNAKVGTTAYVGAYERDNAYGSAQVRWCQSVKRHPSYNSFTKENDVALCKLNEPVNIDQSMARLELNDDNLFPSHGDSLTAVGLGLRQLNGGFPYILQEVEDPAISNEVCNGPDAYGDFYLDVKEDMLCTGYLNGGRGHCGGDSGGPVVQINGDVHTLVGVVSWSGKSNGQGETGCAIEDRPNVSARVSHFVDWIKDNACEMGSEANFCTSSSPPSPSPEPEGYPSYGSCGHGNFPLSYRANLRTDNWGEETSVSSHSFNQDYTALDELIFKQTDLASDTLHYFPSDDEYYCLENDRCYYFEVTDSYGDGISENYNSDPIFEAFLGRKRKFKGNPAFGKVANKIFCTGNACKDRRGFKIGRNKMNCKRYIKGSLDVMKRKCNRRFKGDPVHTYCPETCGRKAGVGACHWWKGMKEGLKEIAESRIVDSDVNTFRQKNKGH